MAWIRQHWDEEYNTNAEQIIKTTVNRQLPILFYLCFLLTWCNRCSSTVSGSKRGLGLLLHLLQQTPPT